MKKFFLLSAGLVLTATASFAAVTASQLAASYQADGFTAIEVTTGATQIKVEAVKSGQKLEVVYDIATGTILSQEQKPAKARDAEDRTVEVKATPGDFTGGATDDDGTPDQGKGDGVSGSDDGAGHDAGDDKGGSSGSGSGGASGSDDGAGHDAGDDHGGSSGRSGHGGGDKSGHGSDDKGGDKGGSKSGGED